MGHRRPFNAKNPGTRRRNSPKSSLPASLHFLGVCLFIYPLFNKVNCWTRAPKDEGTPAPVCTLASRLQRQLLPSISNRMSPVSLHSEVDESDQIRNNPGQRQSLRDPNISWLVYGRRKRTGFVRCINGVRETPSLMHEYYRILQCSELIKDFKSCVDGTRRAQHEMGYQQFSPSKGATSNSKRTGEGGAGC